MAFLTVDGADLFHELAGEAGQPALVLVHGGMCDHRDWTGQIAALSADHRVLTLDLRAHGRSTGDPAQCSVARWAADINALVDTLGLAPALLVGHSLGTRIVAQAAWQRPEHAAGLVLIDGSRLQGSSAAVPPPEISPMPASLTDILNLTVGPHADDAVRSHVLATMGAASPEVMAACVRALESWDLLESDTLWAALPSGLPMLAIQSTYHDRHTPRRSLAGAGETTPWLDFLRRERPGIEVATLPRTGHFSMMERPGEVNALILDFARRAFGEGR